MREIVKEWLLASPVPTVETQRLWAVVAALVLAWGLSATWSQKVRALAFVPPLTLGALALVRALQRAWLADDAFISFRYAANFARGLGPVWNEGERVEGYTNPLWMALAALGESLGVPAPWFITALNLLVLFLFITGLWFGVRRAFPEAVPVLPTVLALAPAVREFGTSGLETLPASASITFAALAVLNGARWRVAAFWVCLAALLRPDHALFFAPLGIAAIATGSLARRARAAADFVIPASVFALFWAARWAWYGDPYPNTYYAKSASLPYWEQGVIYVVEFVASTRIWWPVLAAPLLVIVLRLSSPKARVTSPSARRAPFFIFAICGASLWLVYAARVGGDFMEYRFALTSLPLLGLAAEAAIWNQVRAPLGARLAVAFIALLPLAQGEGLIGSGKKTEHIARESSFYPVTTWVPLVINNGEFRKAKAIEAAKPPPVMMAAGCIGMIGYFNPDLPIFDTYGKASRSVARRPITRRGRPGHEKVATTDELREAGVVWSIDPVWTTLNSETRLSFPNGEAWLVRFDPELTAWAAKHGRAPTEMGVLAKVREPALAATNLHALEALFEKNTVPLEAWFSKQSVIPPRSFRCDALRRDCSVDVKCEEEWLELTGDSSCVVAFDGGAPARGVACRGAGSATVRCKDEGRRNWLLSRQPGSLEARLTFARRTGASSMARVLDSSADDAKAWLIRALDFESPDALKAVTVSGDAMTVHAGTAAKQAEVVGFGGKSLVNSYAGGDARRGELKLEVQLDGTSEALVSLWFGGGDDCVSEFVEVRADDKLLGKACGAKTETLQQFAFLVPAGSQRVTVRAVDASSEGWGHLLLDDVKVWTLPVK